jgi:hypothetical protein
MDSLPGHIPSVTHRHTDALVTIILVSVRQEFALPLGLALLGLG